MVKLSSIFMGMVAFSAVIAAIALVIADMRQTYQIDVSNEFNSTYNKITELGGIAAGLQGNLTGEQIQTQGFFETVTVGAFKLIRLFVYVPNVLFSMVTGMANASANALGFPDFVIPVIMIFLIGTVTFLIIAAVMKSDAI